MLIKTVAIAIFSAASALLFSLLFNNFINLGDLPSLLFLVAATIVFLAVFLLQSLLLDNFSVNLGISVLDVVLMTVIFFSHLSIIMIAASIGVICALISAYYLARLELKNNLEIRFFKIGNNLMRVASSALAIFGIIVYLSLLNLQDPAAARKAVTALVKPAEPITAAYIPGFKVTNSLIEVSRKLIPEELQSAPQATQEEFVRQSSTRLSETIGGFLKVLVRPGDSVVDIVYQATIAKFLKLSSLAKNLVLVGAGLLSFFFVKFFLIFINWLAIMLAFGAYQLLWGAGFFKVEIETKTKKTIVLSEAESGTSAPASL